MKSHVNIPIFIPHYGCPNTCVFCNQRKITGHQSFNLSEVDAEIEEALKTVRPEQKCQIAFFGGSFTGIPRGDMTALLGTAKKYIDAGKAESVRLSTRPDYISPEILDILKQYGVASVELGLQSMNDSVLRICKRGHTAEDGKKACRLIKNYGFELIGQMMTGLPGSSYEDDIETAQTIASLGADGARIYPTVIFNDTELSHMAADGSYRIPDEEELLHRTAGALKVFIARHVNVIRIGLQSGEAVLDEKETYNHTYHPSVGEMCYALVFRDILDDKMKELDIAGKEVTVTVPRGCISKAVGQHGVNRRFLTEKYRLKSMSVRESDLLTGYDIKISC